MLYRGVRVLVLLLTVTCCGAVWSSNLTARYYSQTERFYTFVEDKTSNRTLKYIYIRAGSTESAPLVEGQFTTSSLPGFEEDCDVNDIRIYSGENEEDGLYMGSICGGAYKEVFQASTNAMFIIIDVRNIPENFIFTVDYYTVKDCNARVWARSTPRFLRSPSYGGLTRGVADLYNCRWTLTAHDSHRIRITLQYAPGHSSDCSKNISLKESESSSFYKGRELATWCGGADNTFVSFYSDVQVTFYTTTRGLPALQMEYMDIGADPCYEELDVREGEGGSINSPLSSSGVQMDLKVCKWKIKTRPVSRSVIRLNMTFMDLADTPDCTKDVVRVYDAVGLNSAVVKSWCGQDRSAVDLYTSSLIVEYRTGVNHTRQHRGFRLHYSIAQEPLCTHTLTARNTRQTITSPGYPQPFRSYMKCKWTISSTSPELVVKLVVMRSDLEQIPRPLCSRSRLQVYDGLDEDSTLLKSWCRDESMTLQSRGQHILVVFLSENNDLDEREGFSMEYFQGQYREDVEVTTTRTTVYFPNNLRSYYVAGYDARWYLHTHESVHHIAVWFPEVNLHCPSDVITIYDGEPGKSTLTYTFCSGESRSYFSSTGNVTIVFNTRTDKGRGFSLIYKLAYYPGCFRSVQEVNVDQLESRLSSPGLTYYDYMDCSWRFIAMDPSHHVKLNIHSIDIITYAGTRCTSDYLKVYNGHDAASIKLQPTICGKDKWFEMRSSGRYLYVEFHSDEFKTGEGFQITYSSFDPNAGDDGDEEDSNFPLAEIVGVSVALVFLICLLTGLYICKRRRNAYERSEDVPQTSEEMSAVQFTRTPEPSAPPPPADFPRNPRDSNSVPRGAPPSYAEVEHLDPGRGGKDDEAPPPSYIEAVSEGMVRLVSSQPSQNSHV